MTCVRDILADKGERILTVSADASVHAAAMLMNEHKIGSLLVLRDNALIGIFTERDILLRVVAPQRDLQTTRVQEVMTGDMVCCRPQTTLDEARNVMKSRRLCQLLVVGDSNEVLGIISSGDLNAYRKQEQVVNRIDFVSFGDVHMFMYATDELYVESLNPASKGRRPDLFCRQTNMQGFPPARVHLEDLRDAENSRLVTYILVAHLWSMDLDFTVLDVGAHAGLFSLKLASFLRTCSRKNKIICFEPGSVGELTQHNISINGLGDHVRLERLAIADYSGPTLFSETLGHTDAGQLVTQAGGDIIVPCETLSSYLAEHDIRENLLIKIDTEGMESAVIRDIEKTIDERHVILFFEFSPSRFPSEGEMHEFMNSMDNRFYLFDVFHAVDPSLVDPITPANRELFLKRYREGGPHPNLAQFRAGAKVYHTDILAVPRNLPGISDLLRRLEKLRPRQLTYWYDD